MKYSWIVSEILFIYNTNIFTGLLLKNIKRLWGGIHCTYERFPWMFPTDMFGISCMNVPAWRTGRRLEVHIELLYGYGRENNRGEIDKKDRSFRNSGYNIIPRSWYTIDTRRAEYRNWTESSPREPVSRLSRSRSARSRAIRDCYSLIYKTSDDTRFTATRYTSSIRQVPVGADVQWFSRPFVSCDNTMLSV